TAFRKLLDEKQHLAFIYDEFGSWLGVITLEDIIEKIIGEEIVDETDIVVDMRLLAKKRWESRNQ
ncbi:MAG: CNNM domain-containing protein, partial [Wohlfahrtiimonas sp.]